MSPLKKAPFTSVKRPFFRIVREVHHGLIRKLVELAKSQETGILEVRSENARTRLYLADGVIVLADEGAVAETLGRILTREKILAEADYEHVLEAMAQNSENGESSRFGEIVVKLGFLTQAQVDAALAAQVQHKVLNCLRWQDATLAFEKHAALAKGLARFPTELEPILIRAGFGVMAVDEHDRITSFLEKPADPPGIPGSPEFALASMGIYVFTTEFLIDQLRRDAADPASARDFGKDIIPHIVKNGKAIAHRFPRSCVRSSPGAESYWRDAGTLDAYWEANIDLTDVVPGLDLYDRDWPIWTYGEIVPPAKFVHDVDGRRGRATNSLVSGGCIISGSELTCSLLFTGVHVHSFGSIEGAVILPYANIGRGTRLKNVIIDRGVAIPDGLVVGHDADHDAARFRRTDKGICLITQRMIDRLVN